MDHQPFEDWILDDQPLGRSEKYQLDAHLKGCTTCSALAEVNLALRSTRMAEPRDGFTGRFQRRLVAHKKAARRRNLWGFSLLAVTVMGILAGVGWPVLKELVVSPVNLVVSWSTTLVTFWGSLQAMIRAGVVLARVAPGFVPGYIWIIILGAVGGWSLIWVLSLMKFTKRMQGV